METLEEVLACELCDACVENGIIIATLAQQLTLVVENAARFLMVHGRQSELEARTPRSSHSVVDEVLDRVISLGRCQIGAPRMRVSLVRHAVLLHIAELRILLSRTQKLLLRNRGASKLLAETEAKIVNLGRSMKRFGHCRSREYQYPSSSHYLGTGGLPRQPLMELYNRFSQGWWPDLR